MRIFKKPGYIIVALILVFIIYKRYFDDSKYVAFLNAQVDKVLNDIKHQDYFALQEKLTLKNKKQTSIEDIENFCQALRLSQEYKFTLKDYSKNNNEVNVTGTVIDNNKKLPLELIFVENNSTYLIKSGKIASRNLTANKKVFPILEQNGTNK